MKFHKAATFLTGFPGSPSCWHGLLKKTPVEVTTTGCSKIKLNWTPQICQHRISVPYCRSIHIFKRKSTSGTFGKSVHICHHVSLIKKPDQDLTQRHNLGNSLYWLQSHFCGPGQSWSLFSTDRFWSANGLWQRDVQGGTLTTSPRSGHGWRVLSPWGAWLAETTWKECDL